MTDYLGNKVNGNTALFDLLLSKGEHWYLLVSKYNKTFASGLPKKLLRHYIFGNKKKLKLTQSDVKSLRAITKLTSNSKFTSKLSKLKDFSGNFSFFSQALPVGTLGNFYFITNISVKNICYIKAKKEYTYKLKGTAKVKDHWNFDWKILEYITGKSSRSRGGQIRTMIGSIIPGDPFDITSVNVNVESKGKSTKRIGRISLKTYFLDIK